jgi:hypothetical protein
VSSSDTALTTGASCLQPGHQSAVNLSSTGLSEFFTVVSKSFSTNSFTIYKPPFSKGLSKVKQFILSDVENGGSK